MHTNENLGYDWMSNFQSWKIYTQRIQVAVAGAERSSAKLTSIGTRHRHRNMSMMEKTLQQQQQQHTEQSALHLMIGFHNEGKCFEPLIQILVAFAIACVQKQSVDGAAWTVISIWIVSPIVPHFTNPRYTLNAYAFNSRCMASRPFRFFTDIYLLFYRNFGENGKLRLIRWSI